MTNNLRNAHLAKILSIEKANEKVFDDYITKKINEAINEGSLQVTIERRIRSSDRTVLEDEGYTVISSDDFEEPPRLPHTIVRWNK